MVGRRNVVVSRYIPMILFTVLTNAAAQIMLKKGVTSAMDSRADHGHILSLALRVLFEKYVILGLFVFVVSMASHLVVLSRVELSFAYPFLSLAYVVVAAYAYFVFKEDVNAYRIVGISLICLGTVFISRS
jgi:drug/metabolite transporter (DMT)-like permease